jgi:arylsulfatase A-like enzyme/HEAT repeat protein
LRPAIITGLIFGVSEAAVVGLADSNLFLSILEFLRFTVVAGCLGISIVLLLNRFGSFLLSLLPPYSRVRARLSLLVVTLVAWPLCGRALWLLSSGRRLHDFPYRPWLVVFVALIAAALLGVIARSLVLNHRRLQPGAARALWVVLVALAIAALAADAQVLRRLYPAFHVVLACFACVTAASAAAFLRVRPRSVRRSLIWASCGVVAGCAAPFLLRGVGSAPNLGFAVEQAAPLSGKVLRAMAAGNPSSPLVGVTPARASVPFTPLSANGGIDLRGKDVLLITIDALRADRLAAYGAHQTFTPVLDKLASQSVVFTRAYSQTPHTSYAIGSLLTGKYLRPVLSLPNAPREHMTLPRLLRRYGYRTAGFYPPAVFFVDEERFSALSEDHFGFEYVKEMFAKASDRVPQLERYLDGVDAGHPLFVWVHLFEPHEPYETQPGFALGDEPEQRYDSEVAAADAAVGDLLRVFRERRPGATLIVSADHGEEFGDHGGYHHGTTLFDEQVRVPLLWSSPGQTTARVVNAPVELVDVAPTVLSALRIPRDARMLGDDLTGVLAGTEPPKSLRAFASTDEQRMWTDGHWKAICETASDQCRLFDLQQDPAERRDRSAEQPQILADLYRELNGLMASLPNFEAMALQGGGGWPDALARARLGDVSAGPSLLPLLADARADVRAEAARATASLGVVQAKSLLRSLRTQDTDTDVRAEAAIASLALGDGSAHVLVQQLFESAQEAGSDQLDLIRRAALALALEDPEPVREVLLQWVEDTTASEVERERAMRALGVRRDRRTVLALIDLMDEVRLRPAIATTLGELGGRLAQDALAHALEAERYPEARAAEAKALSKLGDSRTRSLLLRMLGTETGVPGGLDLWLTLAGPFTGSHGFVFDLRRVFDEHAATSGTRAREVLRGAWECTESEVGCRPGTGPTGENGARIELRSGLAPRGPSRFIADVTAASSGEFLVLDGERMRLRAGDNSIAIALPEARGSRKLTVSSSPGVRMRLFAIVPHADDIAPPPPEPYDAGPEELALPGR